MKKLLTLLLLSPLAFAFENERLSDEEFKATKEAQKERLKKNLDE